MPWEDFSKGVYLAEVEWEEDSEAPTGWTKWAVPGYEFVYVERDNDSSFAAGIQYLKEHDLPLVGAAMISPTPRRADNMCSSRSEDCRCELV